jgi:hypothetical protein
LVDEGVDEVVAVVLREADGAVVGPGARGEGRGGRDANGGVVGVYVGDRVMGVVYGAPLDYGGCLAFLLAMLMLIILMAGGHKPRCLGQVGCISSFRWTTKRLDTSMARRGKVQ